MATLAAAGGLIELTCDPGLRPRLGVHLHKANQSRRQA